MTFFFDQLERFRRGRGDSDPNALSFYSPSPLPRALAHRMFQEGRKEVSVLPDLSLPSGDTVPLIILFTEKESAGEAWGCRRAQDFRDH